LNAKRRPREYLTVKEVGKLVEGARSRGRYGRRDATMILVAYGHGLRASELCALRWDQVDPERGLVHVRRLKNGTPSVHPMGGGVTITATAYLCQGSQLMTRHARPCAGRPRRHAAASPDESPRFISFLLMGGSSFAAWMPGTRPGMTAVGSLRNWY
jgi:integrase